MTDSNVYPYSSSTWRVVRQLENAILKGSYDDLSNKKDNFMFSNKEIVLKYGVSEKTAAKAISILHQREVILFIRGRGYEIQKGAAEAINFWRKVEFKEGLRRLIQDLEPVEMTRGEFDEFVDGIIMA